MAQTPPSPLRGGWPRSGRVGSARQRSSLCSFLQVPEDELPRTRVTFEMRQKAKGLRRFATKTEVLLWYELRDLKTDGFKFRRQSPIGPYIADFVCFDPRLVVEIDGDSHETSQGRRHDTNRDAYLNSLGFGVMRVDAPDVLDSAWHVAQRVKGYAERCRTNPTRPLRGHPPLKGEGEIAP